MLRFGRGMLPLFAATALAMAIGCGGSGSSGSGGQAGAPGSGGASSGPMRVDMDALFPAGPGRDLVLNNCQNCHTFVPIVVLQMDQDAWQRNSLDHRERVANLTEEEFATVYTYLAANFGPHRPVPELPKALLETWTSY